MNKYLISLIIPPLLVLCCIMIKNETNPSSKMINQVNFASVKITDSFWSPS